MSRIAVPLLATAALGSALNAGVFFGFSAFVMRALGRLPDQRGIDAMRVINLAVVQSAFMPLFLGTTLLCAATGLWSFTLPAGTRRALILTASIGFLVGCFAVTVAANVPLNDRLAVATAPEALELWPDYLRRWTAWNTTRTIAPSIASLLFALAASPVFGDWTAE